MFGFSSADGPHSPMTKATSNNSPQVLRVDPEHHTLQLMQVAVARISGRIRLDLTSDRVVLSGSVEFWHQKQSLQESIRGLSADRMICNSVQVGAGRTR